MTHLSERELQLQDLEFPKIFQKIIRDKSIISLGPGEPDFVTPKPLLEYTKRMAIGKLATKSYSMKIQKCKSTFNPKVPVVQLGIIKPVTRVVTGFSVQLIEPNRF